MLHTFCLRQLAETIDGQLQLGSMPPLGGDLEPVGPVVTDVRRIRPGDVYWALQTAPDNLAARAEEAFARGAAGAVVSGRRLEPWAGTFSVVVEDPQSALWRLARRIRAEFTGRMLALAGSLDQTTTQRMIAAVLAPQLHGWSPKRAANVPLGLPLSLLELSEEHDFCVVDYGPQEPEEILALSHLCDPQIVVINSLTNQRTGTLDEHAGICESLLLAALPEDGWAVLNGDDRPLRTSGQPAGAQVVLVGRGVHCDVTASHVRSRSGELSFTIDDTPFRVPMRGRETLPAALAAYAVGRIFEIPPPTMAAALGRLEMPPQGCEATSGRGVFVMEET